ncbi:hypothetical protein NDU88_004520 [Pleurodeles waltl]|uniref:Uncharacterized protein n=1 Tax=Pleurodeles waltl TaxID=8319 RepID=A0AAV7T9C9_PLEWA|nr:hypothetical protein NDU88_004520 [Pleurodeles waltl]
MDGPACPGVDNSPLATARAAWLGGALCTITWDPVVCCWCFMWLRALNEAAAFSVNASGGRTTPSAAGGEQSGGPQPKHSAQVASSVPSSPGARSDSQLQTAARADTFVLSARAAPHLETTVSRGPVTAHTVAKSPEVLLFPRELPVPQVSEAPASGVALGVLLPCCRPSGFRSLSPCRSAPIPSLRALSPRPRAASTRSLGSGRGSRSQRAASISSSGPRERSATSLLQGARGSTPASPGLQAPGARSDSRAPDGVHAVRGALLAASLSSRSRSNSRLRGRVQSAGSQGHPCTYLGSSSPLRRRGTGPRVPTSDAAFGAAAPCHLHGVPRVRSRLIRFIKPPLLRFESRGSGMPPRSPLIESDYPDAVRSSRSSRLPCLAAWPRPL